MDDGWNARRRRTLRARQRSSIGAWITLAYPDERRGEELEERGKGGEREDGKREAAGGLQITGCIVLPFDPPVTSTPIDRARVYTAVIARAAEKGAYYPAESEAY